MHKHEAGVRDDCRWCVLDRLMPELAGDVGRANLERYVAIGLDAIASASEESHRSVAGILLTVRYGNGPIMAASEVADNLADILRNTMADSQSFDDLTVTGEVRYE